MIDVGDPFPQFNLQDQTGERVSLEGLKGSKAVLYFYPKDDTPGCTVEACEFRDSLKAIPGARVLGLSPDDVKSHKKFAEKFGLAFSLLADTDHRLADQCGIWVEKSMYGKKYMGVERTTYLLDEKGVVARVWRKVKPEGHAQEVAAAVAERP